MPSQPQAPKARPAHLRAVPPSKATVPSVARSIRPAPLVLPAPVRLAHRVA